MSGRHATAAELSAYVFGTLDASRIPELEEHCATCDACAEALAGEARLELAFEQVARQPARPPAARPLRAAAYGAAGVVAMAAAVLLWFSHGTPSASAAEGGATAGHHAMEDGAILDARNDAQDGG